MRKRGARPYRRAGRQPLGQRRRLQPSGPGMLCNIRHSERLDHKHMIEPMGSAPTVGWIGGSASRWACATLAHHAGLSSLAERRMALLNAGIRISVGSGSSGPSILMTAEGGYRALALHDPVLAGLRPLMRDCVQVSSARRPPSVERPKFSSTPVVSAMSRAIASPKPVPGRFSSQRTPRPSPAIAASLMPGPSSSIRRLASSRPACPPTRTRRCAHLCALSSRLPATSISSPSSLG